MVFILIGTIIILGIICWVVVRHNKNSIIKELNSVKIEFSNLLVLHDKWNKKTVKKINNNLAKLDIVSMEEVNECIFSLFDNNNVDTIYNVVEVEKNDTIEYNVSMENKCEDFSMVLKLFYTKGVNDDMMYYNSNKSVVDFNSHFKAYWYKYSLSYVNDNDITIKNYLYMRIGENNYVEIPITINAVIYPYEINDREGKMYYSLK